MCGDFKGLWEVNLYVVRGRYNVYYCCDILCDWERYGCVLYGYIFCFHVGVCGVVERWSGTLV